MVRWPHEPGAAHLHPCRRGGARRWRLARVVPDAAGPRRRDLRGDLRGGAWPDPRGGGDDRRADARAGADPSGARRVRAGVGGTDRARQRPQSGLGARESGGRWPRPGPAAARPARRGGATVRAGDAAVRSMLHQALHLAFWAVLLLAASTLHLAALVPPVAAGCGPREVAADRAGRGTDSDATGPGRGIDGRAGVAREIGRRPGGHERVVLAGVLAQGDVQDWRSHGPARDR